MSLSLAPGAQRGASATAGRWSFGTVGFLEARSCLVYIGGVFCPGWDRPLLRLQSVSVFRSMLAE